MSSYGAYCDKGWWSKLDWENTRRFRELLRDEGVQGLGSYEWFEGEPLYRGEPLTGRMTQFEKAAFETMKKERR